ncbi:MAG TPA: hypothetical protein VGM01_13235 [Ktedonobacteraceae bacterium]
MHKHRRSWNVMLACFAMGPAQRAVDIDVFYHPSKVTGKQPGAWPLPKYNQTLFCGMTHKQRRYTQGWMARGR